MALVPRVIEDHLTVVVLSMSSLVCVLQGFGKGFVGFL